MRKQFFTTYAQLMPWIKSTHQFGYKNGYIEDTVHGTIRHLPFLTNQGADCDKYQISSLQNISVNSPVQSFEAMEIYEAMIKVDAAIIDQNLKSRLINMVHDSMVF